MDFSAALHLLKDGQLVQRTGWNGKGMFLFLVPDSTFLVNRAPLLGIYEEGTRIDYHAHIDMRTADGTVVPWLASQTDLLTDDWSVVTESQGSKSPSDAVSKTERVSIGDGYYDRATKSPRYGESQNDFADRTTYKDSVTESPSDPIQDLADAFAKVPSLNHESPSDEDRISLPSVDEWRKQYLQDWTPNTNDFKFGPKSKDYWLDRQDEAPLYGFTREVSREELERLYPTKVGWDLNDAYRAGTLPRAKSPSDQVLSFKEESVDFGHATGICVTVGDQRHAWKISKTPADVTLAERIEAIRGLLDYIEQNEQTSEWAAQFAGPKNVHGFPEALDKVREEDRQEAVARGDYYYAAEEQRINRMLRVWQLALVAL